MNAIRVSILTLAGIALLFSNANANRVFKCSGGEKVQKGDSTYSVLKKCGEPAYRETISSIGCDKEEKWHYDCFERRYIVELIFKKGVFVDQNRGEESKGVQSCYQPEE